MRQCFVIDGCIFLSQLFALDFLLVVRQVRLGKAHSLILGIILYDRRMTLICSLGACGVENTDGDFICAISATLFDSESDGGNPNNSPFCGRRAEVSSGTTNHPGEISS